MATDGLTVKVEFDKENAMNCVKTVLMDEYGMTLDELAELCKAKQEGRLRECVRGKWLMPDYPICCAIKCSVCGETEYLDDPDQYEHWRFCPLCGARMDGGGKH